MIGVLSKCSCIQSLIWHIVWLLYKLFIMHSIVHKEIFVWKYFALYFFTNWSVHVYFNCAWARIYYSAGEPFGSESLFHGWRYCNWFLFCTKNLRFGVLVEHRKEKNWVSLGWLWKASDCGATKNEFLHWRVAKSVRLWVVGNERNGKKWRDQDMEKVLFSWISQFKSCSLNVSHTWRFQHKALYSVLYCEVLLAQG